VKEHEAETWAHKRMREHGVAVPRVMTTGAKAYVRRKIRTAIRSGAKRIDPAAAKFAKRPQPVRRVTVDDLFDNPTGWLTGKNKSPA
jgi:hypothetical protein